jgi:hypothetical protein
MNLLEDQRDLKHTFLDSYKDEMYEKVIHDGRLWFELLIEGC